MVIICGIGGLDGVVDPLLQLIRLKITIANASIRSKLNMVMFPIKNFEVLEPYYSNVWVIYYIVILLLLFN
jgi:hypothetical protein